MKLESAPPQRSSLSDQITALEKQVLETHSQPVISVSDRPPQQQKQTQQSWWAIYASTFFTIFLAECGDKTQLSTLLMSAESQSPWIVFVGAAAALITTSLLGVLLGQWLAKHLSPRKLEIAAGTSLLLIAIALVGDILLS
ncbi:TMEM165/GDT1 family protein [Chroococcidiopsis sp.]|uniref:TMEM165/GDT1 family protein n=1 Tax=Chroococcidiopsis sp. TaxID=3088168 RepID=UPI003F35BDAF